MGRPSSGARGRHEPAREGAGPRRAGDREGPHPDRARDRRARGRHRRARPGGRPDARRVPRAADRRAPSGDRRPSRSGGCAGHHALPGRSRDEGRGAGLAGDRHPVPRLRADHHPGRRRPLHGPDHPRRARRDHRPRAAADDPAGGPGGPGAPGAPDPGGLRGEEPADGAPRGGPGPAPRARRAGPRRDPGTGRLTPTPSHLEEEAMGLARKDLLEIRSLEPGEIQTILDTAASMKEIASREIKKVPALRGKTVVNLFMEPSTRTRTSFEIAGKWLSADVINVSGSSSSVVKGETLVDTARNIEAMSPDCVVIRHAASGAAHMLARALRCSIVNAGDGMHEHPTQALLDLLTIREKRGHLEGLSVAIVGDIAHSRVARSNIAGMRKMGMSVTVAGPPTLIPPGVEELGVKVARRLEDAIRDVDVIMMLRLQQERMTANYIPSLREYSRLYGLSLDKLRGARDDVLIMHPGPVNRGIEMAPEVADGPYSVILNQVANGVAVRMAILYLLIGAKGAEV